MTDGESWVYRFFDEDSVLLYVGFTTDLGTRITAHGRQKAWWPEVRSVQVERYNSRPDGLRAERVAILREQPVHNQARYETLDGKTPRRTFRIAEGLSLAAAKRAAERGETLTDVVRRALEQYTRR